MRTQPALTLIAMLFLVACNTASKKNKKENTTAVHSEKEPEKSSKTVFTYNGYDYLETFANDVFHEAFDVDIWELAQVYEWQVNEGHIPIVFFVTKEETPQFNVLVPATKENEFKLQQLKTPESSALNYYRQAHFDFYDFFEEDLNNDGKKELVVAAEISGMSHNKDGMIPVHLIKFVVLSYYNNVVQFNQQLTDEYNKITGTDKDDINETSMAILHKKYHRLGNVAEASNDTREKMKLLLQEMNITSDTYSGHSNEFVEVMKSDTAYVFDQMYLENGYYFVADEENSFSLDSISSYDYPVLFTNNHYYNVLKIIKIDVSENEIHFNFEALVAGENSNDNPEFLSATIQNINNFWLLKHNNTLLVTNAVRNTFEKINGNENQ